MGCCGEFLAAVWVSFEEKEEEVLEDVLFVELMVVVGELCIRVFCGKDVGRRVRC